MKLYVGINATIFVGLKSMGMVKNCYHPDLTPQSAPHMCAQPVYFVKTLRCHGTHQGHFSNMEPPVESLRDGVSVFRTYVLL